jgi:cell division initiation protein
MSITPVEVRHAQLSRAPFGYSRRATDNLLEAIAQSYEQTWWERADLRDEVERLQAELARFRDMERLLRDTMMSAERAAEDLRAQARREYDMLLQEARVKAREIVLEAEAERERMRAELRRLQTSRSELRASYRAFLQAAMERLDSDLDEPGVPRDLVEPAAVAEPDDRPAAAGTETSALEDTEGGPDAAAPESAADETETPTQVA